MAQAKPITNCNHTDRKHFAKGLCHSCYNLAWNNRSPEAREKWLKSLKDNYKPVDYMKKHGEHLFRRYGITYEDFLRIRAEQNDSCVICNKQFSRTPHVDHDHETNLTRQLICSGCNLKVGVFESDKDIVKEIILYLYKHNSNAVKRLIQVCSELQLHLENNAK